jgi:hypothetical protein
MTTRLRTFLLLLISIAIAAAPLRGALALGAQSTADSEPHCAGMLHNMPSSGDSTQQQADAQDSRDCCHQCDGSCTDSHCTDCAHSGIAITHSIAIPSELLDTPQAAPLLVSSPHGTFSPPFRPPASI